MPLCFPTKRRVALRRSKHSFRPFPGHTGYGIGMTPCTAVSGLASYQAQKLAEEVGFQDRVWYDWVRPVAGQVAGQGRMASQQCRADPSSQHEYGWRPRRSVICRRPLDRGRPATLSIVPSGCFVKDPRHGAPWAAAHCTACRHHTGPAERADGPYGTLVATQGLQEHVALQPLQYVGIFNLTANCTSYLNRMSGTHCCNVP